MSRIRGGAENIDPFLFGKIGHGRCARITFLLELFD
jgi:hypothetical protein